MDHVYLDNAASTPVADEVIAEMLPYLKHQYGNPSSIHKFGRETTRAIQQGRPSLHHIGVGAMLDVKRLRPTDGLVIVEKQPQA